MLKPLNADQMKIVSNLYVSRPSFQNGLDRLLQDEMKSAMELSERLNKFISASEPESTKTTTVKKAVKKSGTTGKRGRPPGSKNKPKPKDKAVPVTDGEALDAVETKRTHGQSILEVLAGKSDGLSASEILEAITNSNFENYTIPSKATLQTTLVGLRDKKAVKTRGSRPNTKYLAK